MHYCRYVCFMDGRNGSKKSRNKVSFLSSQWWVLKDARKQRPLIAVFRHTDKMLRTLDRTPRKQKRHLANFFTQIKRHPDKTVTRQTDLDNRSHGLISLRQYVTWDKMSADKRSAGIEFIRQRSLGTKHHLRKKSCNNELWYCQYPTLS